VSELGDRVRLAVLYGSLARGTEGADSDIDLLLVSDELALEDLYRLFWPVEERLARSIHPTLYTTEEFQRRRDQGNAFVKKVLAGPHIVLKEDHHGWLASG
jgi:predicted nucleotidyltransferase